MDKMDTDLQATEQQMLHHLRNLPWDSNVDALVRWEELLEHTAQVRIRLQQSREERTLRS